MKIVAQQPTLDTSAYAAGDCVGGLLTFDLGKVGARTVHIANAYILDDNSSPDSADLDLHLFAVSSMVGTDQSPFVVTQANFLAGNWLGKINFPTANYAATPIGTNAAALLATVAANLRVPLRNGKLYGQLVATATPTFAASQLIIALAIEEYA